MILKIKQFYFLLIVILSGSEESLYFERRDSSLLRWFRYAFQATQPKPQNDKI